jgi:hypothetical protein
MFKGFDGLRLYTKKVCLLSGQVSVLLVSLLSLHLAGCGLLGNHRSLGPSDPSPVPSDLSVLPSQTSLSLGQGFNSLGGVPYSLGYEVCGSAKVANEFAIGSVGGVMITLSHARDSASVVEAVSKPLTSALVYASGLPSAVFPIKMSTNALASSFAFDQARDLTKIYGVNEAVAVLRVRQVVRAKTGDFAVPSATLERYAANPGSMYSKCGDRFVSGVVQGAEVVAVLKCQTQSDELRQKLVADLEASSGVFGINDATKVQDALNKFRTEADGKCSWQVALVGGTQSSPDLDRIVESSVRHVSAARESDNAATIEIETVAYSHIQDQSFKSQILDKTDLALTTQRGYVDSIKVSQGTLVSALEKVVSGGDKASGGITPLQDALEKSRVAADACIRDVYNPELCKSLEKWTVSGR